MTELEIAHLLDFDFEASRYIGTGAIERLAEEREALLVALKTIQWSGHSGVGHGDPGFNLCPECRAAAPSSGWRNAGKHEAGCSIGTAIAKAEEPYCR